MRHRPGFRPGAIGGYLIVGLLGGIIGGVIAALVLRGTMPQVTSVVNPPPYTTAPQTSPSDTSDAVTQAVKLVGPAVVNIDTTIAPPPSDGGLPDMLHQFFGVPEQQPMPRQGMGSGMVIDGKQGLVLTNNHVVAGANKIQVILPDKRAFTGSVVGTDPFGDVAVVKVDGHDLPQVELGNSDLAQIGETVIAIGNPFGLGSTVTTGVVSAEHRELQASNQVPLENLIQTDAAINPGNSGGPLCDIHGRVIAMNTAIIQQAQGIGFAVAVNSIKQSVNQIMKYGHGRRPWLGVHLTNNNSEIAAQLKVPTNTGVVVAQVESGTPADAAGLRAGDVIVAFNGAKVDDQETLRRDIESTPIGNTITIAVFRGSQRQEFHVKIGERPAPQPSEEQP